MIDCIGIPRETAERCLALTERVLAAQGDQAEPNLVQLQHSLAELLQPPASISPEHSTQEAK